LSLKSDLVELKNHIVKHLLAIENQNLILYQLSLSQYNLSINMRPNINPTLYKKNVSSFCIFITECSPPVAISIFII